jgi:hypothetical protein
LCGKESFFDIVSHVKRLTREKRTIEACVVPMAEGHDPADAGSRGEIE